LGVSFKWDSTVDATGAPLGGNPIGGDAVRMVGYGTLALTAGVGGLVFTEALAGGSAVLTEPGLAQVTSNRLAGNGFRDEIAGLLKKAGFQVETEAYKWTIFGRRYIDIDVWKNGVNLGGIEAKFGEAVYSASQRAKDALLSMGGYIVNVVRGGRR
jgi:hypothetical protein